MPAPSAQRSDTGDSFWVSLRYFNFYRIAIAAVFLLAVLVYGDLLNLGSHAPHLFTAVSGLYLALAICFQAVMRKWPTYFDIQLSVHVITDIVAFVVMMYASSGFRSGIGVMLLTSLAGAAMILTALGDIAHALSTGQMPNLQVDVAAITGGVGLVFAKDHNVSNAGLAKK